jgi:hypothetical protein
MDYAVVRQVLDNRLDHSRPSDRPWSRRQPCSNTRWSTFGCRRRRFIDLENHDSSRVCVLHLRCIEAQRLAQSKRLKLLKCCVARIPATIYIFAEASDWSENEEHLQRRSARAFRPLPRAGACLPQARNFSFTANAQSPPTPATSSTSRVGQVLTIQIPTRIQLLRHHVLLRHPSIRPDSVKLTPHPQS